MSFPKAVMRDVRAWQVPVATGIRQICTHPRTARHSEGLHAAPPPPPSPGQATDGSHEQAATMSSLGTRRSAGSVSTQPLARHGPPSQGSQGHGPAPQPRPAPCSVPGAQRQKWWEGPTPEMRELWAESPLGVTGSGPPAPTDPAAGSPALVGGCVGVVRERLRLPAAQGPPGPGPRTPLLTGYGCCAETGRSGAGPPRGLCRATLAGL